MHWHYDLSISGLPATIIVLLAIWKVSDFVLLAFRHFIRK